MRKNVQDAYLKVFSSLYFGLINDVCLSNHNEDTNVHSEGIWKATYYSKDSIILHLHYTIYDVCYAFYEKMCTIFEAIGDKKYIIL